jgi:hypothetical protein
MALHELKIWPEPFNAVVTLRKTHEIRSCTDRIFEVGDRLFLREWVPERSTYTGASAYVDVLYITPGGHFGLPPSLCVMSIQLV